MIHMNFTKKWTGNHDQFLLQIEGQINRGTFLSVIGPSGSGKTSLLRVLAGLIIPDEGEILVDNQRWFNSKSNHSISPGKRKLGYVFQDYALFPNMNVKKNLLFAQSGDDQDGMLNELIEIMELKSFLDRYPHSLSGGQQQRVALARSLVQKPRILLLDEPLSALDHQMRTRLQQYILKVHRRYELTTILVSHNLSEVIRLSDRIWVLEQGRIERKGTTSEYLQKHNLDGKFKFTGLVVSIQPVDVIIILSILINNEVVKVVSNPEEVREINIGDQVMVASKAFNPIIRKIQVE